MNFFEFVKNNLMGINIVVVISSSLARFFSKKLPKNYYLDNLEKYSDLLDKMPQPKYKRDYLNNIKKKLVWEKVCGYTVKGIEKERIAISLVNADKYNLISIANLNAIINYFTIKKETIVPVKLFAISEIIIGLFFPVIFLIIILMNLSFVFGSNNIILQIAAMSLTIILAIVCLLIAITPIKRYKLYRNIMKDKDFLPRANSELKNIIKNDAEHGITD